MLRSLVSLYSYLVIGRVVLSYFPLTPGGAMATLFSVLYRVTEPVLGPVRRIVPTIGMFDFSPMVVFFGLQILASALPG